MTVASDVTVGFTPAAVEVVQACWRHCESMYVWGQAERDRAAASLGRALAQVIGLGGTVTVDGPLSLYVVTHYGMHVGMIFHQDRPETAARRIAETTGMPYEEVLPIVEAGPLPGEWSLHS